MTPTPPTSADMHEAAVLLSKGGMLISRPARVAFGKSYLALEADLTIAEYALKKMAENPLILPTEQAIAKEALRKIRNSPI